ncbi:PfaB family protein [Psychromonas sp.]|uniref:PfaB family protein n=1 Tax=Psychromonas sp. TaxID=1884585 RepID=UPI003566FEBD
MPDLKRKGNQAFYNLNSRLSIIGLDAQFDGLSNIDRVEAALYKGGLHLRERQDKDTRLEQSEYVSLCLSSADRVLTANKLARKLVAVIHIKDAGGVLHTDGLDYFSVTRVADLGAALKLAEQLITEFNIAVLLVAAKSDSARDAIQDKASISFADDFNGYGNNNGVVSLLLSSREFAAAQGCYTYSYLHAAASSDNCGQPSKVIKQALQSAGVTAEMINSVEVSALAESQLSELESAALFAGYADVPALNTAISCCKSVLGENGSLSQLLGLLNCVFVLQQRYRAAIKDWTSPASEQVQAWSESAFYFLNHAAADFPKADGASRYATFSCLSADHYTHIVLQENNDQLVHSNGFNASSDLTLFVLADNDQAGLLQKLHCLSADLHTSSFKSLAKQCFQLFSQQKNKQFKIVLLAETCELLNKEIKLAISGIDNAFAGQTDWKTPKGSYFTARPMAAKNNVAFLYPGIGATYVGLGQDLFHLFPEIYPDVLAMADNIGASLKNELMHPRSVTSLSYKALQELDLNLRKDLANIAECGVGFACVFSKIFTQVFNINADFSAGYSMGEVSMFAALGCWKNPGLMSERLANSTTFRQRLSGELTALREQWNLPDGNDSCQPIWETYTIKGKASDVTQAIEQGERVYITIINTPDSLTIGGYPQDCLRVIKRLGVTAIALNMPNAIHSEPAYTEYQNMIALYSMDVSERIHTKIYSSSCYLPVPQHKHAIAVSIAKCLCEPVDFPRLINTLAAQGAAVFIEMGAGRSLCSWTDKILKSSVFTENDLQPDFLTVPVNSKGADPQLTFARAVAKLVSFGVDINLKSFFDGTIIQPVQAVK